MRNSKTTTRLASALVIALMAAEPASAACTRLAFSVNDYGKDGPIKDAKKLLDTYIAKWTAERGIKTYRTGKKDVNCELFLDVIVFDEHTCKAEATVCWDGPAVSGPIQAETPPAAPAAQPGVAIKKPATPRPVTAAAVTSTPAVIETGTVSGAAIVPTAPAASPKASPPADAATPVKPVVAAPAPKVEPAAVKAADQVTEQALQAAQRAAAAAERAAAAAERAAAAAAAAERGSVKAQ
ncbi:MAG: hypothetical protein SH859_16120 [Hyphomicrobium aestuarii]|nr:hypothetical protein [Hyphomicrobium aestuarii]